MSTYLVVTCDHQDCAALHVDPSITTWVARAHAEHEQGWHIDRYGDYCPDHCEAAAEAPE